jgi:REP element-mobilizing transposase RayT
MPNRPNESPMAEPVAYFLTWPTYGTWLPGDEHGWVKRHHGFQLPDPMTKLESAARMAEDACRLDDEQRSLVEATIAEHCRIRGWTLHAVNCRSNHLHIVVTASQHPDELREQFKAWSTRRLRELDTQRVAGTLAERHAPRKNWWAERGSKRYLNDEDSLEAAILYVRDCQDFDRGGMHV